MNRDFSLEIKITTYTNREVYVKMLLFNNEDIDYFIDVGRGDFSLTKLLDPINVMGPSNHIWCRMKPHRPGSIDFFKNAVKIPAKAYIETEDLSLSERCTFELPGKYFVSSARTILLYEDEGLESCVGSVYIVGETSFELE